jgi:hypothetical protein
VTDLDGLWLTALQEVINLGAHEVKDVLNGVSLNLEVIRSRSANPKAPQGELASFATSAADQLELLTTRTEAMLFLARPARDPANVAVTLKHLASLLVPAVKSDGGSLTVEGYERSSPTAASARATRLALAGGLLGLIRAGGGGRCRLEGGHEPVVRFSHESAVASLDRAIAAAIAEGGIRHERSGKDLLLTFPADES